MSLTDSSVFSNRLTLATLPRTERGKPLVLSADPKGENFLYTNNNSVIIRNLAKPEIADIYTQHSTAVTVAKYSPSGFYIASADKSGKIRIWDTVNKEHILKNEYQPISGPIADLAWSADSQRICCVGEGREKYGHVFLADTGTSNGDITGQSRPVNSCDFKPSRPFRILTGSEDNTTAVYEGPPFKFKTTKTEHQRYVQSVRYSPDGVFWVSGGFEGKLFLYDGKDSELIAELIDEAVTGGTGGPRAHAGGIYAVAWSPDGKKLLSASGDKTCKMWNVDTRKVETTFVMGTEIEDQQLGCLWAGNFMVSVSLSGNINYLDPANPSKPSRILKGHNKPITSMTVKDETAIVTASSDGRVIEWNAKTGVSKSVGGEGHGHQVNDMEFLTDKLAASVGIDDSLRYFDVASGQGYLSGKSHKLKSQPKSVHHSGQLTAVVTAKSLVLFHNDQLVLEENIDFDSNCVALHPEANDLALGDSSGNAVHVYAISGNGDGVTSKKKVTLTGAPTSLAYSPDGKYLVSGDSNRKVTLFEVGADYEKANSREWGFHSAKVNCVAWSPDSLFVCSGGLDCALIVWSVKAPERHLILKSAHVQSQITAVKWINEAAVASSGQDSNLKIWDVEWKN